MDDRFLAMVFMGKKYCGRYNMAVFRHSRTDYRNNQKKERIEIDIFSMENSKLWRVWKQQITLNI